MLKPSGTIYAIALLLLAQPVFADDMSDPMRPPRSAANVVERQTNQPRWNLTGILVSPERKLAMINNQLIGVGGQVDGARVRNIYGNSVELDIGGHSIVLRPLAGSLRREK